MTRHSSKPNKLRNVNPVRDSAVNVTIQKWKIYYIKIKIIALIINLDETDPFEIDTCKCKSKDGASVSELLALFNCSSDG